jgi:hypothetical protein
MVLSIFGNVWNGNSHKKFLDQDEIGKLIDAIHEPTQKDYLRNRWLHRKRGFDRTLQAVTACG